MSKFLDTIQIDTLENFFSMYVEEITDVLSSVTGIEIESKLNPIYDLDYEKFLTNFKKLVFLEFIISDFFSFYFALETKLAAIVVDFIVGGDGKDVKDEEFGDLKFGILNEVLEEFKGRFKELFESIFGNNYKLQYSEVKILSSDAFLDKSKNYIIVDNSIEINEKNYSIFLIFQKEDAVKFASKLISINTGNNASTSVQQEEVLKQSIDKTSVSEVSKLEDKQVENKKSESFVNMPNQNNNDLKTKQLSKDKIQDFQNKNIPSSFIDREVEVFKPEFQEFSDSSTKTHFHNQLELLLDVKVKLSAVIGSKYVTFKDLIDMGEGTVIELDSLVGEPIKIYANNKVVATGEVVVIEDKFGIRIKNIVSKKMRLENLTK